MYLSKSPIYEPPSRFQVLPSCKGAPMEIPIPEAFFNTSSRVPSKGGPPHVPLFEPSNSFPKEAPMRRDACLQRLFYLSFRVPSKGALSASSLHRTPTESETIHVQSPFQPSPKVPGRQAHSRFPI